MLSNKVKALVDNTVKITENQFFRFLREGLLRKSRAPSTNNRLPAEVTRCQVDHAAARDGGGGGDLQVLYFEEHAHGPIQLDTLAVRETERHIVVKDCVHVLDPDGVDVPVVQNVPAARLVGRVRQVHLAEYFRQQAVGPVACRWIKHTVQLVRRNGLRVQRQQVRWQAESLLLGTSQGIQADGFATASRPDDHRGVACEHRLVELHDLVHLEVVDIIVLRALFHLLKMLFDG
mmetsp:Transcript_31776/g.82220  ORF Transcript_31776/g.82220 Transcript_31776/m.82220 type:complete len:233 (-) Transcript_31776:523-1221(-)